MIKNILKLSLTIIFTGIYASIIAQPASYTVSNAHSHNDYAHKVPFYPAFKKGFGSIEADIFLRNKELLVAHSKNDLSGAGTLEELYINPLLKELKKQRNENRKLNLLIDLKDNYKEVLPVLIKKLEPLLPYARGLDKAGQITILIQRFRPAPAEYANYPEYIFFDDDLILPHTAAQWARVGLVSLNFAKFSKWTGIFALPAADSTALAKVTGQVHASGKQIRFWAAPDTRKSWTAQMNLKTDFIGTDDIGGLAKFLRKTSK